MLIQNNRSAQLTPVWLLAFACCCSPSLCFFRKKETPHTVLEAVLSKSKENSRNMMSLVTKLNTTQASRW